MRVAFMGTPEFACAPLERLLQSPHEVRFVVTQPSRPKGRGQRPADPPVKRLAETRGVRVFQPEDPKDPTLPRLIRDEGVDVLVVAAYGRLLPEDVLSAPRLGCLNVHPSLLPEYRGAAPVQRALMDGRLETGVTIMKMVREMDAGPLVAQQSLPIHDDDDALSLSNALSVIGADLLLRVLDDAERSGAIEGVEQDAARATYAPRIRKEEGEIDWRETSHKLMFRLRALTPWPGLYTVIAGRRAQILQAEPIEPDEARRWGAREHWAPGVVTALVKDYGFTVRTGDGHWLLRRIKVEGRAAVDAAAFVRGTRLVVGRRLAEAPDVKS